MTHDPALILRVADTMSLLLFLKPYRALTPAAQECARGEAIRVLDAVVPMVLAGEVATA